MAYQKLDKVTYMYFIARGIHPSGGVAGFSLKDHRPPDTSGHLHLPLFHLPLCWLTRYSTSTPFLRRANPRGPGNGVRVAFAHRLSSCTAVLVCRTCGYGTLSTRYPFALFTYITSNALSCTFGSCQAVGLNWRLRACVSDRGSTCVLSGNMVFGMTLTV